MKTIQELSILVTTSIIAAIAVNYFSPAGIALVGQWDTAKGVITANEKNDIVLDDLEIGDVALAKKLCDSQKFIFVDARSRDDYDEGHIMSSTVVCFSINSGAQESFAGPLIFRDFLILVLGLHVFFYRNVRKLCILSLRPAHP